MKSSQNESATDGKHSLTEPIALDEGGGKGSSYVSGTQAIKASQVSQGPCTTSSLSHIQLDDFQN